MRKACEYALESSHKEAAIKFGIDEQSTRRWLIMYFDKLKIQKSTYYPFYNLNSSNLGHPNQGRKVKDPEMEKRLLAYYSDSMEKEIFKDKSNEEIIIHLQIKAN